MTPASTPAVASAPRESLLRAHSEWKRSWDAGPGSLRSAGPAVQYGDTAPDVELLAGDGTPVALRQLWSDQPCLLVFLRHYGCGCARGRVHQLREQFEDLEAAGVRVVAIGQGDPERSTFWAEKFELPCPLLSDPGRRAFDAYGLVEGQIWQMMDMTPERFAGLDQAIAGVCETRWAEGWPPVDSPWLLPGEFVIDPSGTIRFAYRYQYCSNYPERGVLLGAVGHARGLW